MDCQMRCHHATLNIDPTEIFYNSNPYYRFGIIFQQSGTTGWGFWVLRNCVELVFLIIQTYSIGLFSITAKNGQFLGAQNLIVLAQISLSLC